MTNQELQQLVSEYLIAICGKVDANWHHEFHNFLSWLIKTHCIVSREKVRELYDCYKQHEAVTNEKGLHEAMIIARGSMAAFRDIFGKELFEEMSEK